ncbi:hypothetical protein MPLA_1290003 [Mesorhizobium sp. ORS 3359]|nr:hypothetical protein MPLA_1290003 [Mesorhizobium sp. ORS 3359]
MEATTSLVRSWMFSPQTTARIVMDCLVSDWEPPRAIDSVFARYWKQFSAVASLRVKPGTKVSLSANDIRPYASTLNQPPHGQLASAAPRLQCQPWAKCL